MNSFIKHIQNLNERSRKRWLVALTSSSMLVVIAFWVLYMNMSVDSVQTPTSQPPIARATENPSVLETFTAGFSTVGASLKHELNRVDTYLGNTIGTANTITVSKPSAVFVSPMDTTIPPTPLP